MASPISSEKLGISNPILTSDGTPGVTALPASDRYSTLVCGIFMLNMVLGTGPITLPFAFNSAGIVLGTGFLAVLMCFSFVTATFMVESMAIANRVGHDSRELAWDSPADSPVQLVKRMEIGSIAEAVLPQGLTKVPYLILCVYAYGVLTVYVITGTTSLAQEIGFVGGIDSYYIVLACFLLFITPVCLLDFQKTRPLQIFIGIVRLCAVGCMMTFMIRWMVDNNFEHMASESIPLVRPEGIPSLFGNAAFTFMVHHSIPGLVFPLKDHREAKKAIAGAYFVSFVIYFILCLLALWAFGHEQFKKCGNTPGHPCDIQALFNLNFASVDESWAAKFVVCYPVLVVSVFPLVAITLRNNLKGLCGAAQQPPESGFDWKNFGFTLLTVGPPFIVAVFTRDVQAVMTYIGGYFGFSLMYLVPLMLVVYARKKLPDCPSLRSPFFAKPFEYIVGVLWIAALIFITVSLADK